MKRDNFRQVRVPTSLEVDVQVHKIDLSRLAGVLSPATGCDRSRIQMLHSASCAEDVQAQNASREASERSLWGEVALAFVLNFRMLHITLTLLSTHLKGKLAKVRKVVL